MAIIALHSAASALSALNTSLDVTSNNLANVNTPGFKPSRANFQDLLYVEKMQGVQVTGTQTEFTQGPPIATERNLDLAIDGNGFFKVDSPDSPGGYAYTRAGSFTRNKDGQVVLANSQGQKLEPEFVIPREADGITIDQTGMVSYTVPGSPDQVQVGRLQLSGFINPSGLKSVGGNLYEETSASGPAVDGEPGADNYGRIMQNYIEGSAVDPTRELIDLIKTQRAFEMNSNTIRTADATLQTVAQLKR
jgi:flagellar basal-body rod protein FlgG